MSKVTTVRYGRMRTRALFSVDTRDDIEPGDVCVIRTSRGEELGTVLARPVGPDEEPEEGKVGCGNGACGSCASPRGRIVRRAKPEEYEDHRDRERRGADAEIRSARRIVKELGLDLRVVDAEPLLNGRKVVVYFTASQRIDFKELVPKLSKEFDARIEMNQVGARDEARLVGDMAACGRELCCRTFLHDLQPVSMRMAKQQKKTLDPTKIAGQCGKLKCCLRYEDEVYVELQKTMPKRGVWVRFDQSVGRIVSVDLLLQKVVVDVRGKREIVSVSDLLETGIQPPKEGDPVPKAPKKVRPLKVPVRPAAERDEADEPSTPTEAPAARDGERTWSRSKEAQPEDVDPRDEVEPDREEERPEESGRELSGRRRVRSRRRRRGGDEPTQERDSEQRRETDSDGAPEGDREASSERSEGRRRRRRRRGERRPEGEEASQSPDREDDTREGSDRPRRRRRRGGDRRPERGDEPRSSSEAEGPREDGDRPRRRRRRSGSGSGSGSGQAPPPSGGEKGESSDSESGRRPSRRRRSRGGKPDKGSESDSSSSSEQRGSRRRRRRRGGGGAGSDRRGSPSEPSGD